MMKKIKCNEYSNIKIIIAVMSGKGGVGKSSVTSLIAVTLRNAGYKVGIMDADITGPSIPKVFGINKERADQTLKGIEPTVTNSGIKVTSINLMVDEEEQPVVWRGPKISGIVEQFITDVNWGELDYLLIDLPPGTGDVPLTIMQSIDVHGVIIVSTPQSLVNLIVKKSINMANMLKVPILGLIDNMSYFECQECHKIHHIFGESKLDKVAEEMGLKLIAEIPIDPELTRLSDEGKIELYPQMNVVFGDYFTEEILRVIKE